MKLLMPSFVNTSHSGSGSGPSSQARTVISTVSDTEPVIEPMAFPIPDISGMTISVPRISAT